MVKAKLTKIESDIKGLHSKIIKGTLSKEEITLLENLEGRKRSILLKEEELWKLKSSALWLQQGDCNSKLFYKYASYRKNVNTIWDIDSRNGATVKNGDEIKNEATNYFQNLFVNPSSNYILH